MTRCGIYRIVSPPGHCYVGQSVDIDRRWAEYRQGGRNGARLAKSFAAHGLNAHTFEVLELCAEADLLARERHWQDVLKSCGERGLNIHPTTGRERSGKVSAETRKRMSEAQSGERNPHFGKRGAETSTFGRPRTESERGAIRRYQSTKGRFVMQIDTYTGQTVRRIRVRDLIAEGWSQGNISSCCTGRLKTYRGFTFRYEDHP